MGKIINFPNVEDTEKCIPIVEKFGEIVASLVNLSDEILEFSDEDQKSINEMITEGLMDFIDCEYVEVMEENK